MKNCATFLFCFLFIFSVIQGSNNGRESSYDFTVEVPFSDNDNWEPAVIGDKEGNIYLATTQYNPECADGFYCPNPSILYKTSSNFGITWGEEEHFICSYSMGCLGGDICCQNDPVMAISSNSSLLFTWMNDWNISFSRSDDHGATWPLYVNKVSGIGSVDNIADKPWITIDPSGHVYIGFNIRFPFVTVSGDGGKSWKEPKMLQRNESIYFYNTGFAANKESACTCANAVPLDESGSFSEMWIFCTPDHGDTWSQLLLFTSLQSPPCPTWAQCGTPNEFLLSGIALAVDEGGVYYALYGQVNEALGPSRLVITASMDNGITWTTPLIISSSNPTANQLFPMISAGKDGDVRIAWLDNREGGLWNCYYNYLSFSSSSSSFTIGPQELRLSNYQGNDIPYKTPLGFLFPYGDYGQIFVDANGAAHVTWGEGPSWVGPGNTWYSRQILPPPPSSL